MEKKINFRRGGDWHGRATFGMGRAKLLVFDSKILSLSFFFFSHHVWTNTCKTN